MTSTSNLLTDIRLEVRHKDFRPVYQVVEDKLRQPGGKGFTVDLGTCDERDNLAQAVVIRLLTPRGDLSHLGHPDFGSRLHELVGQENTETKRNLARLYILESLQHERRIQKVVAVTVKPAQGRRSAIEISLQVVPSGDAKSLFIGPFALELT